MGKLTTTILREDEDPATRTRRLNQLIRDLSDDQEAVRRYLQELDVRSVDLEARASDPAANRRVLWKWDEATTAQFALRRVSKYSTADPALNVVTVDGRKRLRVSSNGTSADTVLAFAFWQIDIRLPRRYVVEWRSLNPAVGSGDLEPGWMIHTNGRGSTNLFGFTVTQDQNEAFLHVMRVEDGDGVATVLDLAGALPITVLPGNAYRLTVEGRNPVVTQPYLSTLTLVEKGTGQDAAADGFTNTDFASYDAGWDAQLVEGGGLAIRSTVSGAQSWTADFWDMRILKHPMDE
jgi:hypothetical protein